ncbi:hypothetical protein PF010_g17347 [Phytophthora fragariae]|uniref:HTH CENPB-type domain-containing protein n=1 Tax=Phytophthora fragariae TaxID=53985 RepID=A0A6A3QLF6_9STRA|nr:hypothetical protein PF003_g32163 [Phytophthora fragariae]KAE8934639.1 hypothetical protein PF009_g15385 [Phytophthora fragariae]KAE8982880.1 hypothetical protein PF011_g21427 [Phytophthora fragariae]KAE9078919.1 hypothetical protein PF007_g23657 [Phytophthora fragariae]KAE9093804.1 hypothetical protein PF010_g17347 [Phytophthora fragariae]
MIADQSIGGGWYRRFMDHHPLFASRISQGVIKARYSVTMHDITLLFNSLLEAIIENRLDDSRVFNMDATVFQINKGFKRVVSGRSSKNV